MPVNNSSKDTQDPTTETYVDNTTKESYLHNLTTDTPVDDGSLNTTGDGARERVRRGAEDVATTVTLIGTDATTGDPLPVSRSCDNDDLDPYDLVGTDIAFVMLINTKDNGKVIPEPDDVASFEYNCTLPLDDDAMTAYVQIYEPDKTIHDCDLTVRPSRYQCYLPYADLNTYVT